ncbi:MAG: DNA (cytosine-5-)-methyltransferase [Flavobacteriaceae bacterium]|nr:DNA (cytosine-5-)-methyltransferase [Flavobacteriaceae bacterium]
MRKFKVCELFAGVGGFRLGLENSGGYEVVWSNQWEPSTKAQHASWVYEARFGSKGHTNGNIENVPTAEIPYHDVLVGGFPCQDYSVANTLKSSKGLLGKKGVLWWSIHRILDEKKTKPKYLILENVDRLLKSPAQQRGRDFAIMLRSLVDLGYAVEWRVINASDYGMPQRRRRVFIVAYHNSTKIFKSVLAHTSDWIEHQGVLANALPIKGEHKKKNTFALDGDLVTLSNTFNLEQGLSPFLNTGLCFEGRITTMQAEAYHSGNRTSLGDLLEGKVDEAFYIPVEDIDKWKYLKGAKKETRTSSSGFKYTYSEGNMVFPDALDQPSRTIITGEGGRTPSRFKHVVNTSKGLRRLTPIELERLNMFPDDHTALKGVSDAKRAFFMGNALVVGIVERIGRSLYDQTQL